MIKKIVKIILDEEDVRKLIIVKKLLGKMSIDDLKDSGLTEEEGYLCQDFYGTLRDSI